MKTINIIYPLLRRPRLCHMQIRPIPCLSTIISNFYSSYSKHNIHCLTLFRMENTSSKIVFRGSTDRFNGVTVHSDKENCNDVNEFAKKLEDSLDFWKENEKRGIWFRVHLDQSDWIPVLTKRGFKFHHAKEDFVMMYLWIPESENCNIPQYAHTMLGVGAVVVNDKSQVLVVQEKYTVLNRRFWKLPGGYVEPGENLVDAAIREVFEETNISTKFHSVLTLRHVHGAMFGCSDIYTVVSLTPLSENIEKCNREIEAAKWMNIDEYLTHPEVLEHSKLFVQQYLDYNKHNIKVNCFHGIHAIAKRPFTMYAVIKHEDKTKDEVGEKSTVDDKT